VSPRTLPILLAFFVMGFVDAMGPLASTVQQQYQLSGFMAGLLPAFAFVAFALLSVPGGVLGARIGMQRLLILAFTINLVGVLVPTLVVPSYALLLGAIFLLGAGTTLLQVAGNPIMRDVSAPGRFAQNLSFAQFVKGVGSVGSTFLVGWLAVGESGWRNAFPVFMIVTAVGLTALMFLRIKETRTTAPPSVASSLALLKEPAFGLAVLGIFLYVGAEVGLSTWLKPRLVGLGLPVERAHLWGPTMLLGCLTVGRLVGGVVLFFVKPHVFFRISAGLGVAGILAILTGNPAIAMGGVVACGLGSANIWPLLFSTTVETRPERSAELSGLMCMAIFGGAVLPPLMGQLIDAFGFAPAFLVPLVSFLYLFALSLRGARPQEA
jgi:MFS transporter, FHS family, L-fucose permease